MEQRGGREGGAGGGKLRVVVVVVCVFCLLAVPPVRSYSFSNVKQLTTDLFASYNKYLRPFVDNSKPTLVYMGLWLSSIVDLDEINQKLVFSCFVHLDWMDPELRWDVNSYNQTSFFAWPQKELWIPDVTIINSVETMAELGFDRNYMYIQDTGFVTWMPGGVYEVSCDIDVTYYPFDSQSCSIVFSTLVSDSSEIELKLDSAIGVNLDFYSESGTWALDSVSTSVFGKLNGKTRVAFTLNLKRLRTFYTLSLIIPVGFLAFTATLVFALPAESGEKMGTAITVLLSYAVYLTIISDQMPQTSLNVSILAVYLNTVLAITSAGVVLSVWILNLHHREDDDDPPSWRTRKLVMMLKTIMCKRKKNSVDPFLQTSKPAREYPTAPCSTVYRAASTMDVDFKKDQSTLDRDAVVPPAFSNKAQDETSSGTDDIPEYTWKEVSVTFDRSLFYLFSIVLAVKTLIILLTLLIGGA